MRCKSNIVFLGALLLAACHNGSDAPSPAPTYTVSVTISGLNGTVTLANNGGNQLPLATNGTSIFSAAIPAGTAYAITVVTQPSTQQCAVSNGSGTVGASNVTNITVTCVTNTYTVGGSVSGLTGSGLVLQNNGGDNLARAADGTFTFAAAVTHGGAYNVTVLTQPTTPAQTCTPSANTGNVTANVTNVVVACVTNLPTGVTNIGAAGGMANGDYGAQIIVPAGALASTVGIGLIRDSSNSPAFALTDIDAVGATYELTPHGQSFATPVTLHIPFDPAQLPNDATPVLYKAETGGVFVALPTTVNGNFLEATVANFSWVIPGYAATKPRMVYALPSAGTFTPVGVGSYRINATTGALTGPTSTALTGDSPTSVVAHPSRRFVYVTNAGSTTMNGVAPNSVSVHSLNTINGKIVGPATATVSTGAPLGYKPTMAVIHPSGKFLYVPNFGSVSNNAGGDINLFTINGATGAMTLSPTVISGAGAQPMGIAFNSLGTFAYVLYGGSTSSNSFSSQVKVYSVDAVTGAFTGPLSGASAGVLGSNPWSIVVDPDGKFAYVVCYSTDEIRAYSINAVTGALTFMSSITTASKPTSLAIDSRGRFLFVGRQMPFLNVNVQSYAINSSTGALTLINGVLTSCIGGACVGPAPVVADPQGQFIFANDVNQGLSAFTVNAASGALASAGNLTNVFIPWPGGVGIPFTFAATGTHPLWQNNCTLGCAMWHTSGGGGGGGAPTNPSPPTSYHLTVTQGAYFGFVTSSPGGIDYGPPTNSNPIGLNNFSAAFSANASVQLCTSPPPQPAQAYDVEWTGSCSGTSTCTSVTVTSDKQCHLEFKPVLGR